MYDVCIKYKNGLSQNFVRCLSLSHTPNYFMFGECDLKRNIKVHKIPNEQIKEIKLTVNSEYRNQLF